MSFESVILLFDSLGFGIAVLATALATIAFYRLAKLHYESSPPLPNPHFPLVSVVVAAWKEGRRVKECVDSILAQDYPKDKIQLILVGGGDSETVRMCRKLSEKKGAVYIEERKRRGKWAALNDGIDAAGGEVIAFTDADCTVGKMWLKALVSRLKDADGTVGLVKPKDLNGFIKRAQVLTPVLNLKYFLLGVPYFSGQCSAFKKSVFGSARFRRSLVEDALLLHDVRKSGFKVKFERRAEVFHSYSRTFAGYVNSQLRVAAGFAKDLWFEPLIFLSLLTVLLSPVFGAIGAHKFIQGTLPLMSWPFAIFTVLGVIYLTFSAKIIGVPGYLRNLPHFIILFSLNGIIGLVALLKLALRLPVEWKIYEK